ncbi:MAG TPA: cytochrome c [Rhodothermales bacterium]|nr:cytochrome c [Rhodothermales bacterium]
MGRPANPERIAAWDIDVRPDGEGLPQGSGSVAEGQVIYTQKCAACHGTTGTEGPNDRLVGRVPNDGFPFWENWETWENKTIGSYWPYATTLWDYINRSMPQNAPGSLTADEVYALTAFLLHRNEIIPEDAVMNAETLPRIEMPARERFIVDDRLRYQEVR